MDDMRGVEIEVGDLIVYPGRKGSSLWATLARVDVIDEHTFRFSGDNSIKVTPIPAKAYDGEKVMAPKQVTLRNLNYIVVVEKGINGKPNDQAGSRIGNASSVGSTEGVGSARLSAA